MQDQLIGQSLDRYQVLSLLGEGGMGAVFKGYDTTLQREVAIKVMHPHFARRPDLQRRFLREARAAARLNHPGIVSVFDFGQTHAYLYIVMEFIAGFDLRQRLEALQSSQQGILLTEAIQLMRQVCLALNYAHRHGILHRDIKPDNIMLKLEAVETLPYRPVLTDLGLAKLLAGESLTDEGASMGTPAYMSPEQAQGQPMDARSDIYSLGILLYELVVGQLPFPIKITLDAIRYHAQETPPPPRSLRPDLPEQLEQIILKALAKQPVDRFSNATVMAEALAEVLPQVVAVAGGVPILAETDTPTSPLPLQPLDPSPPPAPANPFGDTGRISDPDHFFDREDLLRQIFEELGKGANLSLVGEAQIGKSSLLWLICKLGPQRLGRSPESFIYLNLEWVDNEDDFYEALCDALGVEHSRGFKLTRALRGKQFLLCLDEIEKMTWDGFTMRLRSHLRGLADGPDAPLQLVIASRSPLDQLFPDTPELASPLAGICRQLDLLPFSPDASRAFLQRRLASTGITFRPAEIEALLTKTKGHPARLQQAAADLYRHYATSLTLTPSPAACSHPEPHPSPHTPRS